MATITVDELPFPNEDPAAYAVIWVGGLPVPGYCLPIDGDKERDVQQTKSKGSSRDILVDQGMKPNEVTIRIKSMNGAIYRDLYDFYLKYMDPDRPLSRQNIVTVAHPQLYVRGIKQGYFFKAPIPKPTRDEGGVWPWISEFKFKIVGPKTQIGAKSGSSKPKPQQLGGPTDPVFQIAAQRKAVAAIAATEAANRAQISLAPKRPADQRPVLYTPADITKLSDAGDPTARFVADYIQSRSPR
jgi:hypothetical protein